MKAVLNVLTFCIASFLFFSCQKELSIDTSLPGNNDNDTTGNAASLAGNWNFVSLMVNTEYLTSYTQSGIPVKIVVQYKDTTEDNTGYLSITSNTIKATDIGYTFSTNAEIITYAAGIPVGSETLAIDATAPPYSATSPYQQIGNDSLYFPLGSMFEIPDPSGVLPAVHIAAGAKYKITGTDLIITSVMNQDTTITQGGISAIISARASIIANFKKQ